MIKLLRNSNKGSVRRLHRGLDYRDDDERSCGTVAQEKLTYEYTTRCSELRVLDVVGDGAETKTRRR